MTFAVVYTVLQVVVLGTGVMLTLWDPVDPVVIQHRLAQTVDNYGFDENQYTMMCSACGTFVSNGAKHCSRCDKCIDGFDHHCKWLNNCIGLRNYRWFWVLILATETSFCLQTGFTISVLLTDTYENTYPTSPRLIKGLLWSHLALSVVLLVPVTQLLLLHCYLVYNHISTYEWIKRRREKRINPVNCHQNRSRSIDTSVKKESKSQFTQEETQGEGMGRFDDSTLVVSPDPPCDIVLS